MLDVHQCEVVRVIYLPGQGETEDTNHVASRRTLPTLRHRRRALGGGASLGLSVARGDHGARLSTTFLRCLRYLGQLRPPSIT
jgi:hypothetical protein